MNNAEKIVVIEDAIERLRGVIQDLQPIAFGDDWAQGYIINPLKAMCYISIDGAGHVSGISLGAWIKRLKADCESTQGGD